MRVSAAADTLMSRPCSSHVYQVSPTSASVATSSRRKPGVSRRVPRGKPTASGVSIARRVRRNAFNSERCMGVVIDNRRGGGGSTSSGKCLPMIAAVEIGLPVPSVTPSRA